MANLDQQYWIGAVRNLGISETDIDSENLDTHIRWALREFNRFLPKTIITTIALVADQQDYALPADCLTVAWVYYVPAGSSIIPGVDPVPAALRELMPEGGYYHLPSQAMFWDAKFLGLLSESLGSFQMFNTSPTKTLRLYPCPDSSTVGSSANLDYIYTARRSDSEIPEDWETIFVDALMSYVYRTMSNKKIGDVLSFSDSGLTIKKANTSRDYLHLSDAHWYSFLDAAKSWQIQFPTMRSDLNWV